ncbi:sensor domain-containing diguanylate cyclase [[Limnothrix rosea] IAM M-220]|uniref:sensor domain-containing diguanylate cyclase n=1 Tax=[Limnothrix rosea] IAM M-220 TaxID=454133 RepID=UPI0009629190|nr:sensor domain-containing diguanylate cyclase [[Limnothrix rosea] IAM M-220]OKH19944.1 hypothetical protein NIES208_00245 [[Limnothrix rosea] IAM M-220]
MALDTPVKTWIFQTKNIGKVLIGILGLATSISALVLTVLFREIDKNNPFDDFVLSETVHSIGQLGRETLRLQVLLVSLSEQSEVSLLQQQFDILESRVRIVTIQSDYYSLSPSARLELQIYIDNLDFVLSHKPDILAKSITPQKLESITTLLAEMEKTAHGISIENQRYIQRQQKSSALLKKRLFVLLVVTYFSLLFLVITFFAFMIKFVKERQKTLAILNSSEERYQKIVENAEEGIWVLDPSKNIVFLNSKLARQFQTKNGELLNKNALDLCASEEFKVLFKEKILELTVAGAVSFDICLKDRENNRLWFYVNNTFIDFYGDGEQYILGLLTDITKRKKIEEELKMLNKRLTHQANVDELTQIANRRYFNLYAIRMWEQAIREKKALSLALVDIDFFKKYNDYYGHLQGDICLFQVAQVISGAAQRGDDLAARYGGEEFVLLLPGTDQQQAIAIVTEMQDKLAALKLKHQWRDLQGTVTLSIGLVSGIPQEAVSLEKALSLADKALYQAKHDGRNCYSALQF